MAAICHRQHGLEIKVMRIFNTYGPRMHPDDGRVVSNFVMQALAGEPITLYGDGAQTRSFCYVDDLIDAMVAFMATGAEVTGPINVGNPDEFSIRELAEKVLALSGSNSGVEHKALPADDPRQRQPDIAKAREVLGWQPTVSLDEGLVPTMAYFKGLIGEQSAR